tara:strand:+ start:8548 stop:9324 length:777 start_codon:yes stop_codon:yes gene_type:complete
MVMLGGRARVGKTTIAKMIAEFAYHLGFKPIFLPFAGPIKEEAKEKGYSKEKNSIEYRDYCQKMGAALRADDSDYWVNKWASQVQEIIKLEAEDIERGEKYWERVILVDDCRYLNEVAKGRDYDSIQIFISNGEREIDDQEADWRFHESEKMANNIEAKDPNYKGIFSTILLNDGNLDDLKSVIEIYSEVWLGTRVLNEEEKERIQQASQSQLKIEYVSQILDEIFDKFGIDPDDYLEEIEEEEEEDDNDDEFSEGAD